MHRIRVLVVDDSVVARRIVSDALTSDPGIEVAGVAATGRIALAKVDQLTPDVITLDLEMPDMDGMETLAALRKSHPKIPVIMFSALTERGGIATLRALSMGASDYVEKPSSIGGLSGLGFDDARQQVARELIPKVKALGGKRVASLAVREDRALGEGTGNLPARWGSGKQIEIIAIGASTGGPNALASLVSSLPSDLSAPIVIVQHMPVVFTRLLAERLTAASSLVVREAEHGDVLTPGHAWIAPGGSHMALVRSGLQVVIEINQEPPENSCRPSVDVLFRSVAELFPDAALGVILTGMGQDGLRGCGAIKARGGNIIAQDEASSVVWGMPGYVAKAGLADAILPLAAIADELLRRIGHRRKRPSSA